MIWWKLKAHPPSFVCSGKAHKLSNMIYKIVLLVTAALVGQVVGQSGPCEDDPTYRFNGQANKDCNFVATKKNLCKKWGVKSGCKATCDYPCDCFDAETFKWNGEDKECLSLNSEKRKKKFCKKKSTSDSCPRSCGTCCGNVKTFKFKTEAGPARNCHWIGQDDFRINQYCTENWIKKRCSKACGDCKNYAVPPTPAPEKGKTDDSPFDDD